MGSPVPTPVEGGVQFLALLVTVEVLTLVGVTIWVSGVPVIPGLGTSHPTITITSITWEINYQGLTTGYFGPVSQNGCGNCPWTVAGSGTFQETVQLTSSASFFSHDISAIVASPGFSVTGTSPALPVQVAPGGSVSITVSLAAPSGPSAYALVVYIWTS